MTLYFEPDPADDNTPPQLPPLLTATEVPANQDLLAKAVAVAPTTEVGTVFYAADPTVMKLAIRLEPEVPLRQAGQMLFAMMLGLGDAVGALAPPEVAVTYQMPGYLLLNRGRAGVVRLVADPVAGPDDVPGWMIVMAELWLNKPVETVFRQAGAETVEFTNLAEEGGGHISRTRLVESCCRHFLVAVNRWQDDGFRPIYDGWMQRLDAQMPIAFLAPESGEWLGLDEDGGVLVSLDGKPVSVLPHALDSICGVASLD